MKTITRYLLCASSILLLLLSCNKVEKVEQETATVNYKIPFYDIEMKSIDNGSEVNYVWYAVYNADGTLFSECEQPEPIQNGYAICPVTMVLDQAYKVVFLGVHYDADMNPAYEIDPQTATVSQPSSPTVNSGKTDLFHAVDIVERFSGAVTDNLRLQRIVAQVNFGDSSDLQSLEYFPVESSLTLNSVPCSFDLISGGATRDVRDITYAKAALPSGDDTNLTVDGRQYKRLLSAYTFAPADASFVSATLTAINESSASYNYSFPIKNIQIKPNSQTNITGAILSNAAHVTKM